MHTRLPFTPMPERQAIIMIGLQASGKSTLFQTCLQPHGYAHINLDTLRTRHRESTLLADCMAHGRSFVVDNTNPTIADRQRYISEAKRHGYQIIGIYMQSILKDCIARNELRENKVPRLALPATQNKLQMPDMSEGFDAMFFARITDGGFSITPWNT